MNSDLKFVVRFDPGAGDEDDDWKFEFPLLFLLEEDE
jgi:hypothetical protein